MRFELFFIALTGGALEKKRGTLFLNFRACLFKKIYKNYKNQVYLREAFTVKYNPADFYCIAPQCEFTLVIGGR